jgi:small subunit ribosomal protein S6
MSNKRIYELLILIDPDITEERRVEIVTEVEETIARFGSELIRSQFLGRRRLAYEVKRKRFGFYHLFHFHGTDELLDELNHRFRIHELIHKFLIVRLSEKQLEAMPTNLWQAEEEERHTPRETQDAPPREGEDAVAAPAELAAEPTEVTPYVAKEGEAEASTEATEPPAEGPASESEPAEPPSEAEAEVEAEVEDEAAEEASDSEETPPAASAQPDNTEPSAPSEEEKA